MNVRSLLSVAAIVSALALPGAAYAQEEHMIGGKAVPADQVSEVQAKCDELRKAPPAADATAKPDAAAATTGTATEGWMADGMKVDVSKLTIAMCDTGKFMAPAM